MKNPFRELSSGGTMMFTLTMLTFGSYTIISIFLLLWIPGFIPLESIFILPLILFILIFWCCILGIRFYNTFLLDLSRIWRSCLAACVLLSLILSFITFIAYLIEQNSFSEYRGTEAVGSSLIFCFFGLLPFPAAFNKSKKAGIHAVLSLFCALIGFLSLSSACEMILHGFFFFTGGISGLGHNPQEIGISWFSLFGQKVPVVFLYMGYLWRGCVILLPAAFLFYAKMLSELTGEPLRKIFSKPVICLVAVSVACYLSFQLLCWSAKFQLESVQQMLQKRFDRSMAMEELSKLYFSGKNPDKNFWDMLENSLKCPMHDNFDSKSGCLEKLENILRDNDSCRFVILSDHEKSMLDDELEKKSSALMEMDSRMNAGIPKYPVNFKKDNITFLCPPHLAVMRSFCRQISWRTYMALEAKNKPKAFRLAELSRKMAEYGEDERFLSGSLMSIYCYGPYFDLLEWLTENNALSREQIQTISRMLLSLDVKLPRMEKDSLYSEAVGNSNAWEFLLQTTEENEHVYSIRNTAFVMPQFYWLLLLNQLSLTKAYDVDDFGKISSSRNIPRKPAFILRRMFTSASESVHIKFMNLLARSRAERVILACELFRMDTGKYPASASELVPKYLERIPDDPFTGKPLHFRKGELTVESGKIAKDSYYIQTVPKKIEGIQVWSIGPNGKDDDGIYNKQKKQDDIRAVIQTR